MPYAYWLPACSLAASWLSHTSRLQAVVSRCQAQDGKHSGMADSRASQQSQHGTLASDTTMRSLKVDTVLNRVPCGTAQDQRMA